MNYDLAKKLKDAGFPLEWDYKIGRELYFDDEGENPELRSYDPERYIKSVGEGATLVPTLSELIEACEPQKADDFNLYTNLDQWTAHLIYHGHFEGWRGIPRDEMGFVSINIGCSGSTPEEAVANLWLALQDK